MLMDRSDTTRKQSAYALSCVTHKV